MAHRPAVSDFATPLGASLAQTIIAFAMFALSMWVTVKAWEWSRRGWVGALCGLAVFALSVLIFAGPMNVLRITECRGTSSFDLCMSDD